MSAPENKVVQSSGMTLGCRQRHRIGVVVRPGHGLPGNGEDWTPQHCSYSRAIRTFGPGFLAAHIDLADVLDRHCRTLDAVTGEMTELEPFNPAMNKRAAQVRRNLERLEAVRESAGLVHRKFDGATLDVGELDVHFSDCCDGSDQAFFELILVVDNA